jgi:site-specific DNA-methyltransferase (adenine-specific)
MAQKPFSEKNGALNILKHGVGAINIDGCRVPSEPDRPLIISNRGVGNNTYSEGLHGSLSAGKTDLGRHPANLLHDGSDEAIACFPDAKGQQGDVKGTEPSLPTNEIYGQFNERLPSAKRVESDTSAARFFNALPITELDTPIHYCPKAGKADRAGSKHPTVKPIALMRWLCRLVTPPGGTVLDPFGGSGSTAAAALAEGFNPILMEMEPEYIADIKRRFGLESPVTTFSDPDIDDLLGVNPTVNPATIDHGLPEDVMDLL